MFRKILFYIPLRISSFYFTELPVGLGYLAEAARAAGAETAVFDANLGYNEQELDDRVRQFRPDLVAVQMYSAGYRQTYQILENLKQRHPSPAVVCGGAHPSCFGGRVLEDCRAVDLAVVGEGESAIAGLVSGGPPEEIPGLIYRRNGTVVSNPPPAPVADLDTLAFPRYQGFELEKFTERTVNKRLKISICSSRGCPFRCTYCASGLIMGKRFRYRAVEGVLDEMEYWYSGGVRDFSFVDDGFTARRERVFAICDGMEQRGLSGCRLSCDNGIRADQTDREILARMRELGFWRVGIGVEAGTQKALKLLKKGEKLERIRETIALACELGYSVMLFFLTGSPGETMEDVEQSFRLALEYPVDVVSFNNIIPYPGTEMYEELSRRGLLLMPPEEYLNLDPRHSNVPVFETPEIPGPRRRRMLRRAFRVEQKVARRAMARKLAALGLLANIIAFFYGFETIRQAIMSNHLFRRFVLEPVKRRAGR